MLLLGYAITCVCYCANYNISGIAIAMLVMLLCYYDSVFDFLYKMSTYVLGQVITFLFFS